MAIKFGGSKFSKPQTQEAAPVAAQKKAAPAPVEEPVLVTQPGETAQQVDEMAKLNATIKALDPDIKRFGVLKKSLQLIADETGNPAEEVVLVGTAGSKVVYGAKKDQNTLKEGAMKSIIADLKKVMTMDDLLKLLSVSQETVKTYLGEDAVAKYYEKTTNTGPRVLKTVIDG